MADLYSLLTQLWYVWGLLLFIGICVWALWPSRKQEMERHGRIPFEDEEKRDAH